MGEVRLFHGFPSFYKKFIINFSLVCHVIIETMRGDKNDFKLTHRTNKNFETLKEKEQNHMSFLYLILTKNFKLIVMLVGMLLALF